jgi:endoglucanase
VTRRAACAAVALVLIVAVAAAAQAAGIAGSSAAGRGPGFVRVDQVGYTPEATKIAYLMSQRAVPRGRFDVLSSSGRRVMSGRAGPSTGSWSSRWRYVYRLDLSKVRVPGAYRVEVRAARARSPLFRIARAAALYAPREAAAVSFFRAQRDGAAAAGGPLGRQPSHLSDQAATVYSEPSPAQLLKAGFTPAGGQADVSGGWFDAGDYLKFTTTASFADIMLLLAERAHPGEVPGLAAEARVGTDWLMRMYDPSAGRLLYQVGYGDGSARTLGDHDVWRLPQRDDRLTSRSARLLSHRPTFVAGPAGAPISPNIAGRLAAAFGLCAQVYSSSDPPYAARCLRYGEAAYAQARTTNVGPLLGSSPGKYYSEQSWTDDMALGATELHLAASASQPDAYLRDASRWADAYASGNGADQDSLNLYDVAALTDSELANALGAAGVSPADTYPAGRAELLRDLHDQLTIGMGGTAHDPFALADPSRWADTASHALGYAITARLYDRLAGGRTYEAFGQHQLDWALGTNPWGSSFVVGAGSVFPHCVQHEVANLAGSLTGRGRILAGATVGGPTGTAGVRHLGAPDGYRRCPARGANPFAPFDGHGAAYRDDVRSAATSEPTDDASALALLAFSLWRG